LIDETTSYPAISIPLTLIHSLWERKDPHLTLSSKTTNIEKLEGQGEVKPHI